MKNLLIKSNANIKNTLKQLSKTGEKCLVVVDNRNKILGTISDGDVRKALLKGKVYKDKINEFYQKDPIFLKKDNYSLSQAKNILIKKRIDIIPIIGKSRTVVDVLTFEKIFKEILGNVISKTSDDAYLSKLRLEKIGFVFQTFNLLATMCSSSYLIIYI